MDRHLVVACHPEDLLTEFLSVLELNAMADDPPRKLGRGMLGSLS